VKNADKKSFIYRERAGGVGLGRRRIGGAWGYGGVFLSLFIFFEESHMIIIGEKINGSIPSTAKAIADRDEDFIRNLARRQAGTGADYIDVAPQGDKLCLTR
jgi:hypothetical protein